LSIKINYDRIKLRIHRTGEIKTFLEKVIRDEKKVPGDLKFIFTDDVTELDINRKFLSHDYYTDVIAFDYSDGNIVNGEIYISAETVRRNANIYKTTVREELLRVMLHGILHLCGYNDKAKRNKDVMFTKQEELLIRFVKGS
jgi:probable rRNA maturation factor